MTRPRSTLIDLTATPYYHCIARCVRRAFLCGDDSSTGRNFDHRKQWLVDKIRQLGSLFAIDVAAYAIMSNHYHLVLHVNAEKAGAWTDEEVIERWLQLYTGPLLIHRYRQNKEALGDAEMAQVSQLVALWRERLASISWFMGLLNEHIARQANKEDGCTGRFWEGRFKSQALLDEAAVIACMAYVDLNPVRAGIAHDLEHSDFTSIQARIQQIQRETTETTTGKKESSPATPALLPFVESEHQDKHLAAIPYNLKDYLALVDWTGRCVRHDKRGAIAEHTPTILQHLGISDQQWLLLALEIQKKSVIMLSGLEQIRRRQPHRSQAA
ncbi:MAG TPA: transposase [Pseudomonadales bacterium]